MSFAISKDASNAFAFYARVILRIKGGRDKMECEAHQLFGDETSKTFVQQCRSIQTLEGV